MAESADTNDWEAYFDRGVATAQKNRSEADAAFYWASRLDPTRAEPLYARWAMFWIKDRERFLKYLNGDQATLDAHDVQTADSLRRVAFQRNPFVHQGMLMAIYSGLPGGYLENIVSTAWLAYARGQLSEAVDRFARAVDQNPDRNAYLRFVRAAAFVDLQQQDSALAELTALLTQLRKADRESFVSLYQSKELLEYAIGRLYADRRQEAAAREAFGRALAENAAFAPAHYALGAMAQVSRDWENAATEYALAAELDSASVQNRLALGLARYYTRHPDDAVRQLKRATDLEPWYADTYFTLGNVLAAVGDPAAARTAFQRYLQLAPAREASQIAAATKSLQQLIARP